MNEPVGRWKSPPIFISAGAGGLALIVKEEVTPVWLAELTKKALSEKLSNYIDACPKYGM